MEDLNENQLTTLLISSVLGGFVGAFIQHIKEVLKAKLDFRFEVYGDLLTERRLEYQKLWGISKAIPKWPSRKDVGFDEILTISKSLRDWYFQRGGILLTERSKNMYIAVQTELTRIYELKNASEIKSISSEDYIALQEKFSALRTELTIDLMSRDRYKS